MSFYQLLIITVFSNVTANILIKKGVTIAGGVSGQKGQVISDIIHVGLSPLVIMGLSLYGFSFLVWLRVLSFNDLSRAYPIFATLVFLLTSIGSAIFLKENISLIRIIGIVVMLAGIYIVARS